MTGQQTRLPGYRRDNADSDPLKKQLPRERRTVELAKSEERGIVSALRHARTP